MGATAAPRVWAASSAISISGEFGARTATTSPCLTPSERRPAATPRRRASSADQERSCHLPEGPRERTAARDGSTAARAAISCGTLWKGTSGRGGPTISRPSIGPTLLRGTPYAIRRANAVGTPNCVWCPRLLLRGRLLLAELLDHLLLRRAGHRLVLGELHRVLALALRRRAEIRRVPEHLGQRHVRAGDQVAFHGLGVLDDAAPLVELAHHRALELLGRLHLDVQS